MGNLGNFDATSVPPQTEFEPIPPGEYVLAVTESEMKATKDGQGKYLALTMQIVEEGKYKGRKVFTNLNLVNKNTEAVQIANRQLSALCHACGKLRPKDSSELHNRPFKAKVGVLPAKDGYDAKNVIKSYVFDEPRKGNGTRPVAEKTKEPAASYAGSTEVENDEEPPFS